MNHIPGPAQQGVFVIIALDDGDSSEKGERGCMFKDFPIYVEQPQRWLIFEIKSIGSFSASEKSQGHAAFFS
jgi:hypothetical protein